MRIVLAGGTGFVGRALREELLGAGHEVIVLTRQSRAGKRECEKFVVWDGRAQGDWVAQLDGANVVINLAGENIAAKRWTSARKQGILSSRVDATRAIVSAIAQVRKTPEILINASAVGYYGDASDAVLTEASSAGSGFLAATCERWEAEARKAELSGTRVILARLGPVLGEKGGMLSKMIPPFHYFMGASLGTGRQWIPWVHLDDVIGAFLFMLEFEDFSGPVNVTAPVPATMQEFCLALAKTLRRPCGFSLPEFLLKMSLGEMAGIVLSSQKALPEKLLRAGYRFRYSRLPEALEAILKIK